MSSFGDWPDGQLPRKLTEINFIVNEDVDADTTMIGFSSDYTADGYVFYSTPYDMPLHSVWDFDENGNVDAAAEVMVLYALVYLLFF